jgi:hypothetical protein
MASGPHCTRTGLIAGKGKTSVGMRGMQMRWRCYVVKSRRFMRASHPVIALELF